MNKSDKKHISRWGLIFTISVIVILLVGGAIYAQAGPRGQRGGGHPGMGNGPEQGEGPGMGMGPGMGEGRGMGMGSGMGEGRGMQAMFGFQFLMQDPEIMKTMAQIKAIDAINRFDLDKDQVIAFRDLARQAQGIIDEEFGSTRTDLKNALETELSSVLEGNEHNPGFMRDIMQGAREQHEPGAIRDEMEGILTRAENILTEEQIQAIMEEAGPPQEFRERDMNRFNQDRPGMQWFQNLDDDERAQVEERFQDRLGNMSEHRAKGKLMMFLLSPQAVEAMDLWIEAH